MKMITQSERVQNYLRALQSTMMFGNCAGKVTRLPKLHQNSLIVETNIQNGDEDEFPFGKPDEVVRNRLADLQDKIIEAENENERLTSNIKKIRVMGCLYW